MIVTIKMKNSSEMVIEDATVDEVVTMITNLTSSSRIAHITSAELPDYTVIESKVYDN